MTERERDYWREHLAITFEGYRGRDFLWLGLGGYCIGVIVRMLIG